MQTKGLLNAYSCPQTVTTHLYYPSSKQCINVLCIDGYFFTFNRILQKQISIFEFLIHPFDHEFARF